MKKNVSLFCVFCIIFVFLLTACSNSTQISRSETTTSIEAKTTTVTEITTEAESTTKEETTTEKVNSIEDIWQSFKDDITTIAQEMDDLTNADVLIIEEKIENNWAIIRDSSNIVSESDALPEFALSIGALYSKFEAGTNGHNLGEIGWNYLEAKYLNKNSEADSYAEEFIQLYKEVTGVDLNNVIDISTATLGEQNALKKAQSYMKYSAFSREGLIDQLEFEGFTHDEAVFGVDNGHFDWNDAALEKAQSYMSYSGFSYQGLIDQLEYEGFTHDEAVYGVESGNFDWNDAAAKKAQSYMKFSSFSREGLIDQLLYEGFTYEQAEYGAQQVGY